MARWDRYDERVETRATRADVRHLRRQAKAGDELLEHAYKEGLKEGRSEAKAKTSGKRSRGERAVGKRAAGVGRYVARETRRPSRQGGRQAVHELQVPVRRQVAGGLRTAGLTLAVVGLFLFLESAPAVSGALGGASRGLAWLRAPDRSITYAR